LEVNEEEEDFLVNREETRAAPQRSRIQNNNLKVNPIEVDLRSPLESKLPWREAGPPNHFDY